jgi:hypothetical protein
MPSTARPRADEGADGELASVPPGEDTTRKGTRSSRPKLHDRYDGTRGSAAKIAALWGVSRFQVVRALKRHGIEERLLEEDDESSEKPKGRSAGGRSR